MNGKRRKYNISIVQEILEKNGYSLLSKEYKNSQTKIETRCPAKHLWEVRFNDFLTGYRCGFCSGNKKYNLEKVKEIFKKEGYILLSNEYKNNKTNLHSICPNGHDSHSCLGNFLNGFRCLKCSGKEKFTYQFVKNFIEKEGYILLSTEYVRSLDRLKVKCSNGHVRNMIFSGFYNNGSRCAKCNGTAKYTIKELSKKYQDKGYELISTEYSNTKDKLVVRCTNGHLWKSCVSDFLMNKSGCPECKGTRHEKECRSILEKLFSKEFKKHRPDFLKKENGRNLELDGFNRELNLAFEYDGEQHFEPRFGKSYFDKTVEHDALKNELCKKEGVILIRISYKVKNKEKYIKEELTKRGIQWPIFL